LGGISDFVVARELVGDQMCQFGKVNGTLPDDKVAMISGSHTSR